MPQVDVTLITHIIHTLFFVYMFLYIFFLFVLYPIVNHTKFYFKYVNISLILKNILITRIKILNLYIFLKNLKI